MKQKHVLIFVPLFQNNHLSYYSVLVNFIFRDCQVSFVTHSQLVDYQVFGANTQIYLPQGEESLARFIWRLREKFHSADLIVWEELYNRQLLPFLFLLRFSKKSLLTIHNVHKWLNRPKAVFSFSNFLIKMVVDRIKGIIVISPNLLDYIKQENLYSGLLFYVPFSLPAKNPQLLPFDDLIRIVAPGGVNIERRKYHPYLIGLKNYALSDKSKIKIQLVLLGKLEKLSEEELDLIKEINLLTKAEVITWETYLPNSTFQEEIEKSHFLLGNLKMNYNEKRVEEIYGRSKESGVLFLMIKYQKLTLLPSSYPCNEVLSDLVERYDDDPDYLENQFFVDLCKLNPIDHKKRTKEHEQMYLTQRKKLLSII